MTENNWLHTFTRSRQDRWIGGVCGGLGEHTPIPSWTWRLLFTLSVLIWGTGLLVYILLWIFVPEEPERKDIQPAA
jgi:phage shock protein PspC (stress-responsive transcriptional regulator)